MITVGVPAESKEEPRIGLSPETAKKFAKNGAKVLVTSGAGDARISPTTPTRTLAPASRRPTPTR